MSRKKTRKQYTPEFKAEAVKLVLEQGLTRAQAARDLGVVESVLALAELGRRCRSTAARVTTAPQ